MARNRILILCFLLIYAMPSKSAVNRYIVFFTDKEDNGYSINRPHEFLSERALQRRTKQNIVIAFNDLPVSGKYVQWLQSDPALSVFFQTKWLNGVLVEMDESKTEEVRSYSYVKDVQLVAHGRLDSGSSGGRTKKMLNKEIARYEAAESLEQNMFIGADVMHQMDYRGKNILIAVFDSGFDLVDGSSYFSHLFDNDQLVAARDFIRGSDNVFQYDVHGSKVLSCISGYKEGVYSGTAPASDIVLCVTEDVRSEYSIEEYNWIFAAEYADSIGVDVINSSVGYSYFDDDRMDYSYEDLDGRTAVISRAAAIASSKGMLVVCSNGNEGNNFWKYLNAPADADSIISVGAATYDLEKANFSSFGPTSDGRIKPDVSALGARVKIALGEEIIYANGTSFSAPMVAGLAAGLWQAYPQLTNQELIQYIRMTSHQADAPDTLLGYGIPNFIRAYNKIKMNESDVIEKFVVFPNPVTNKRIIYFYTDSLVENSAASLNFYNLKGSYIRTEVLSVTQGVDLIELDVSFLRPGSYILTYVQGSKKKKSKLVVL
ncbi:MAG: S8 family serine peptidase [Cytophagales bacterium]|nr:S8 family serine peptidase [Cytophagales bacterium]